MKSKLIFFFCFCSILLIQFQSRAADEMEGLIDKEKTEQDTWKDTEGELPPALLLGANNAILIYSPAYEASHGNVLCSDLQFDELTELSKEEVTQGEIIVNTKIPRVRESLAESCLIRPGDPLV